MASQMAMDDILARLQRAEIVEDEEEFLSLSPDDIAARQEELHREAAVRQGTKHQCSPTMSSADVAAIRFQNK